MVAGLDRTAWDRVRRAVLMREDYCYLCGRKVDKSLQSNDTWGPTVDHILARSKGGALYDDSNLHLVHRICNSRKGNMSLEEYRYKQHKQQQNSRNWFG